MSGLGLLAVLFGVGLVILVAEIFIPSHGVLSVVGVGFLIAAINRTFEFFGREAGVVAIVACLILVPTMAFVSIKYWPRTPIGRRVIPPNPQLSLEDTSVPVAELQALIGQVGRSGSTLRPVGIGQFGGRRVSCVAQFGMIETGRAIRGVGVRGSNLAVVEHDA
jgi:membrane-bound serine protease (ClpP class)